PIPETEDCARYDPDGRRRGEEGEPEQEASGGPGRIGVDEERRPDRSGEVHGDDEGRGKAGCDGRAGPAPAHPGPRRPATRAQSRPQPSRIRSTVRSPGCAAASGSRTRKTLARRASGSSEETKSGSRP